MALFSRLRHGGGRAAATDNSHGLSVQRLQGKLLTLRNNTHQYRLGRALPWSGRIRQRSNLLLEGRQREHGSVEPPGARGRASVRSYAVPRSEVVRATRYAAADRAGAYDDLILEHAQRNGVRADLVRAVVQVESAFNPYARSPKGALGLMQLMPATIQQFGVNNPFNPKENVRAGVAYLRQLLDRYQNNEELALAAYNAGPGAVDKHGQTVPPYAETRNYVKQVGLLTGQATGHRSRRPHLQGHRRRRWPPSRPLHRQEAVIRPLRGRPEPIRFLGASVLRCLEVLGASVCLGCFGAEAPKCLVFSGVGELKGVRLLGWCTEAPSNPSTEAP